jgi:hypothetical protein
MRCFGTVDCLHLLFHLRISQAKTPTCVSLVSFLVKSLLVWSLTELLLGIRKRPTLVPPAKPLWLLLANLQAHLPMFFPLVVLLPEFLLLANLQAHLPIFYPLVVLLPKFWRLLSQQRQLHTMVMLLLKPIVAQASP